MSEKGYQIQHGPRGGKIWKWDENTIFLSPINFLQVFLSQVGKELDQGGKILYRFSSSSYPRSCLGRKEGKVNTILHGHGGKRRHSTPPVKVEQLIAWPRRKIIKTQGEKISYFRPV
jgi:hypothetical protein